MTTATETVSAAGSDGQNVRAVLIEDIDRAYEACNSNINTYYREYVHPPAGGWGDPLDIPAMPDSVSWALTDLNVLMDPVEMLAYARVRVPDTEAMTDRDDFSEEVLMEVLMDYWDTRD